MTPKADIRKRCALCHTDAVLRDSHLMPKWAYQRAKGESAHPLEIKDGKAFYSSRQTRRHLLCSDCETKFSVPEDYVARLTRPADGAMQLVQKVSPVAGVSRRLVTINADVDVSKIAYFAASIIWRSSAMRLDCRLGQYEEGFRTYLNGSTPFPKQAMLILAMLDSAYDDLDLATWMTEPKTVRAGNVHLHGFMVGGLAFRCFVGQRVDTKLRSVCIARQQAIYHASIINAEEFGDFILAAEVASLAEPRGKFAKEVAAESDAR